MPGKGLPAKSLHLKKEMRAVKVSDIKSVLILGAGTMGRQIGYLCAVYGYHVTLYDLSREILDSALDGIAELNRRFVSMGRIGPQQPAKIMARISATTDPVEAAKDADLISESLPEDPGLKAGIFAQFNKLCPERTIFTTNTSTLVPSMFADSTGRPDKFCALHFHDVRTTKVVDVMPHPGTAPEVVQLLLDFVKGLGQTAISVERENNGYVFNAMLTSLFSSALTLAANGVATVEDIDRAWMGVMNAPVGPFGLMDQVGILTVWSVVNYWAKRTEDSQSFANADFLKQYLDKGLLGAKTNKGFYEYPNPSYRAPEFVAGTTNTDKITD
jgi:3-hydroxybutyryl-CoA dehydrogenase